jgi:hypothetical protein
MGRQTPRWDGCGIELLDPIEGPDPEARMHLFPAQAGPIAEVHFAEVWLKHRVLAQ